MSDTANDSVLASVQEVRFGLFRLHWIFNPTMLEEGCHEMQFFIGLSGQWYTVTYHLKYSDSKSRPFRYSVTVEAGPAREESSDEGEGESSNQSQPQQDFSAVPKAPVYMWVNTDHSSTSGIKIPLLKKGSGQWKCRRWCRKLRDRLTVWIDFGTGYERNNLDVMKGIADMFHSQTRCDVMFHFKDEQSIGAHMLILSAGSPVFADMFQSMNEVEVEITDFNMDVFNQLLTYLYTGVAPRMSEKNITKLLLEAAGDYGVETLKNECARVLTTGGCRITIENVLQTLKWSRKYSVSKLFEASMKFLVENFLEIGNQPEWFELVLNTPDLCMMAFQRLARNHFSVMDNEV